MEILTRIRKAWIRAWAPEMEQVICPNCADWFYRVRTPHPETCCTACNESLMNGWADEIRRTGRVIW